jgi:hypothetical protein
MAVLQHDAMLGVASTQRSSSAALGRPPPLWLGELEAGRPWPWRERALSRVGGGHGDGVRRGGIKMIRWGESEEDDVG